MPSPIPMSAVDTYTAAALPGVAPAAEVADLLVLIAHRACPDKRRFGVRYWDALAERAKGATYTGPTLRLWWGQLCRDLGVDRVWPVDAALLASLLDGGRDRAVLRVLREESATVRLRVQLAANAAKSAAMDVVDLDEGMLV